MTYSKGPTTSHQKACNLWEICIDDENIGKVTHVIIINCIYLINHVFEQAVKNRVTLFASCFSTREISLAFKLAWESLIMRNMFDTDSHWPHTPMGKYHVFLRHHEGFIYIEKMETIKK